MFIVADQPLPSEQASIPVIAQNPQANPPPYVEPPKIQNPVSQLKVHDNRFDNIQAVYQQNIPGYQQSQLYKCGPPSTTNFNKGQFQPNQPQQQFYQKVNNLDPRRFANPYQIANLQIQQKNNKQFFTMPNSRPLIRELNESPRSIAPDVAKKCIRGHPRSMQITARPAYPIANKLMMYPQNGQDSPSEHMMNCQNLEMNNSNNPSQVIRPLNPAVVEIKSR